MTPPFLEIKSENFSQLPFDTIPLPDYVTPKNNQTYKELPYCCAYHQDFYEHLVTLFLDFPECCEAHKEISKNYFFKKENYQDMPDKILTKCAFTQHHLCSRINALDWWADLTEYIEYTVFSFGHPNIGLEHYFFDLEGRLKDRAWLKENNISFIKADKLLGFVRDYRNPSPESQSDSSTLNILFATYQNWLKIFPFELSFFKELKPSFESQLPFIKDGISYNRYLKISKARLHTKDSLIEFLLHSTNLLLSSFNSLEMYKDWAVPDADKIKLELIIEQRKLKINKGYHNPSKDEQTRYRKILKEWLKDEKEFIEDIRSLLPASDKKSSLKDYKLQKLAPYMFDKDLPWFFDAKNIAAQENLVIPTYNYFNEGPGKGFFEPLIFLNLLNKQYQVLITYLNKPSDFIAHLKKIPLDQKESHILLGFILKWFGGYPVECYNEEYYKILKMIEDEFLLFEGATPEKEFCRADSEFRKKLMKLSITGTTSMNTGLDWQTLYDSMEDKPVIKKESFASFDEMFHAAYNNNAVGPFDTEIIKLINRDKYNLEFNIWLQEKKYWLYGDEEGYKGFLTKERFLEFLQYEQAEKAKQVEAHRKEAATWVVNKNVMKPTTKSKSDFTKNKLQTLVIGFASEYGYFRPSTILDEYLRDAESFDDFDFMCNFFLNIHYICQENAALFWNDSHKKDITSWLQKAPIITGVFFDTWFEKKKSITPEKDIVTNKYTIPTYALMHVYLEMFGGQAVSPQNKNELAKKYGHNSGAYLRNQFTFFKNEDKRLDISTSNRRSANEHLDRFRNILPHLRDNAKAYEKAKADLAYLEKEYRKHY